MRVGLGYLTQRVKDDSALARRQCRSYRWLIEPFSVLCFNHILMHPIQLLFIPDVAHATAFCPPILSGRVYLLFQSPCTPCFDVRANLLWFGVERTNYDVHVVRSTINRVQNPLAEVTCFRNLFRHNVTSRHTQNTGRFFHPCSGNKNSRRIRELPAVPILNPTSLIALCSTVLGYAVLLSFCQCYGI